MKAAFREWYMPTPEELQRLWLDGAIVLDANVLLNFYLYPEPTLAEFFKVLEDVAPRLWLPHQAGLEFQQNREKSLPQQRGLLEQLIRNLEDLARDVERLGAPEYHPLLDLSEFETARAGIRTAFQPVLETVRSALSKTPEFDPKTILGCEPIRDHITRLFDNRVGEPLSVPDLEQIYEEGAKRFECEKPPGYKDSAKESPARYADLIIWKEILKRQKSLPEGHRACIFVTNDRKEDWWLRKNNLRLGPRPELVREFFEEIGDNFFMYTPAEFLKGAPIHLKLTVSEQAVIEVERISEASPIVELLRGRQMSLPEPADRERVLGHVYDAMLNGDIHTANDLTLLIHSFGGQYISNYVQVPMFFALINEDYGPIGVRSDPTHRLRDRTVYLQEQRSKDEFIKKAHAAWLAQALYRVRYNSFADDDLLLAFFNSGDSPEAHILLKEAQSFITGPVRW